MCYPVKCTLCGKTTWAGCGAHRESVMNKIPEQDRCKCVEEDKKKNNSKQYSNKK